MIATAARKLRAGPDVAQAGRIESIDGLRAVAAVAVLLAQIGAASRSGRWPELTAPFEVGAVVFLVLTAFLVWRPLALRALTADEVAPVPVLATLRRRAIRLLPAYWVAVIASFVFATGEPTLEFGELVRYLTLTQTYTPELGARPMPQAWTLAAQAGFYVLAPVLARLVVTVASADLGRRIRHQYLLIGSLAAAATIFRVVAVARAGSDVRERTYIDSWLPSQLDVFAAGMLLAVWWAAREVDGRQRAPLAVLRGPAATAACWVAAVVVLAVSWPVLDLGTFYAPEGARSALIRHWVTLVAAAGFVAPLVVHRTSPNAPVGVLASAPLRIAGRLAYGVYLWQVFVIERWLARRIEPGLAIADLAGRPAVAIAPMVVWVTVVTVALAALTWAVVQRPFERVVDRPIPRFWAWTMAITAGAFLFRLWTFVAINTIDPKEGDPFYYHTQANMLAAGLGFSEPFRYLQSGAVIPTAFHPPVYPLLLSVSSFLGSGGYLAHKATTALVSVLMVVLAALVARRVAGVRAGIIAAGITAFYPPLWIIDGTLWSESVYTTGVALVLLAAYRWLDRPDRGRAAMFGLALGLTVLIRGEALIQFPLLAAPLVLFFVPRLRWKERIGQLAIMGVVAVILIAPWTIRSALTFDNPVLLSTNSDEVLYYANCPDTYDPDHPLYGYWSFPCQEAERRRAEQGLTEPEPTPEVGDETERVRFWRNRGVRYALDHKRAWPGVTLARLGRQWDVYRTSQVPLQQRVELRPSDWTRRGQYAYWALVPVAAVGAVVLRRRRERLWPLGVQFLAVSITAVLVYGGLRFRTPGDLAIVILAGVAIDAGLGRVRRDAAGSTDSEDSPGRDTGASSAEP